MTSDNGKEFARHETIADRLKARFYFAHPYASWDRGLNENTQSGILWHQPTCCDSELNSRLLSRSHFRHGYLNARCDRAVIGL